MKISEVTIDDLKNYTHVYHTEDDKLFTTILVACKSFIQGYTGLSSDSIDQNEDLTIALFVLASECYDNRAITVEGSSVNYVVKAILDMHSINLL